MFTGEDLREAKEPGPHGLLKVMIENSSMALALISEIGAKLPKECQEQAAITQACGGIERLLMLLGAAAEDRANG